MRMFSFVCVHFGVYARHLNDAIYVRLDCFGLLFTGIHQYKKQSNNTKIISADGLKRGNVKCAARELISMLLLTLYYPTHARTYNTTTFAIYVTGMFTMCYTQQLPQSVHAITSLDDDPFPVSDTLADLVIRTYTCMHACSHSRTSVHTT